MTSASEWPQGFLGPDKDPRAETEQSRVQSSTHPGLDVCNTISVSASARGERTSTAHLPHMCTWKDMNAIGDLAGAQRDVIMHAHTHKKDTHSGVTSILGFSCSDTGP